MPFWVILTLTLTSDLISIFLYLGHIFFITNNFPQMCLVLDQFLCWHSSRYCDISCCDAFSHLIFRGYNIHHYIYVLLAVKAVLTIQMCFMF